MCLIIFTEITSLVDKTALQILTAGGVGLVYHEQNFNDNYRAENNETDRLTVD